LALAKALSVSTDEFASSEPEREEANSTLSSRTVEGMGEGVYPQVEDDSFSKNSKYPPQAVSEGCRFLVVLSVTDNSGSSG
jgi:hypothetical protein